MKRASASVVIRRPVVIYLAKTYSPTVRSSVLLLGDKAGNRRVIESAHGENHRNEKSTIAVAGALAARIPDDRTGGTRPYARAMPG